MVIKVFESIVRVAIMVALFLLIRFTDFSQIGLSLGSLAVSISALVIFIYGIMYVKNETRALILALQISMILGPGLLVWSIGDKFLWLVLVGMTFLFALFVLLHLGNLKLKFYHKDKKRDKVEFLPLRVEVLASLILVILVVLLG